MSRTNKALIGVASLTAISLLVYLRYNKKKAKKQEERSERVADEGYEFAQDILYPLKRHPLKRFF